MAKKRKQKGTPAASPMRSASVGGRRPLMFGLAGAGALLAIVAVVVTAVLVLGGGGGNTAASTSKKALIVDQLELTQPNQDFVDKASETLTNAGYSVDYIPGKNVTVSTYRTLASGDYGIILLRVHAGLTTERDPITGQTSKESYVSLFTNETYTEGKYPDEVNNLGKATYPDGSGGFFGVSPELIKKIPGDFNGATVILMGCDGLASTRTGNVFLDRGASSFVSWSDQVSGAHTDDATEKLLEHMLIDKLPVSQAVDKTAAEVGPDPTYKGELRVLTG